MCIYWHIWTSIVLGCEDVPHLVICLGDGDNKRVGAVSVITVPHTTSRALLGQSPPQSHTHLPLPNRRLKKETSSHLWGISRIKPFLNVFFLQTFQRLNLIQFEEPSLSHIISWSFNLRNPYFIPYH